MGEPVGPEPEDHVTILPRLVAPLAGKGLALRRKKRKVEPQMNTDKKGLFFLICVHLCSSVVPPFCFLARPGRVDCGAAR
jgi:hypothetical protein